MKYLRKEIEYKPWRMTLVLAVLFVAIVLGIVQKIDQMNQEGPQEFQEFIDQSESLTEAMCDDSGGEWEPCGSACRENEAIDPDTACMELCTEYCYCTHDGECPHDHHCDEYIEDTGVCVIDF